MFFSTLIGVRRTPFDDWFDPIPSVDTKLFVDPFLIYKDADPKWAGTHDKLVAHFQMAFELLARCGCEPGTLGCKSAVRMLTFPEPSETCLGYTAGGTSGSGSGKELAKLMMSAMCAAISRGVDYLPHFELLGVFQKGIGPDRISDLACTILKPDLIEYTQQIAKARSIPMTDQTVRAGQFDAARKSFINCTVKLPTNPVTGGPLLLVPKRFLAVLPTLNAEDWWESNRAREVREEFDQDLMGRVDKKAIVDAARRHSENVQAWSGDCEQDDGRPYNLEKDPRGLYQWAGAASQYVSTHPVQLAEATDHAGFLTVIETIIGRFGHFVEKSGGWRLLWDSVDGADKEKPEEAIQLLFLGIAKAYCEANNINLDREVELGRGPVDFKFSSGYRHRALIEVKKLENGKFWHGLETQLPSYLDSDDSRDGWLLAVQFRSKGVSCERASALRGEVAAVAKRLDLDLRYGLVDSRPRASASKIDPAGEIGLGAA